ncbi:MAG: DUF4142 domain-containing protein [Pseudomonadota bacterium]
MKKSGIVALVASLLVAQLGVAAGFLTPEEFVSRASAAGHSEVQLGKLAVQKSSAADVRAFAQKMIDDHGAAGAELAALAKKKGLAVALPGEAQLAIQAELQQKNGTEFDAAYAKQMLTDHDDAVSLFSAAGTLADADLAAFARKALPVLTQHQQMAKRLVTAHPSP